MTHINKIIKNTTTVFLFGIITFVLGYLLRLLIARNMSLSEFGLFYSVFAFVCIFNLFRSFGLEISLTKFISSKKKNNNTSEIMSAIFMVFITKLIIAFIISMSLILLATFLSKYYFKSPLAAPLLILIALSYLVSIFLDVFSAIFQGLQKMCLYSLIEFLRNFFVIVITLIFFYFNHKQTAPAWGYFLSPVIITIIFLIFYRNQVFKFFKSFKLKNDTNKKTFNTLIAYAIPVFIGSIGVLFVNYTDTLTLTYFKTLEDVGLYNAALPTASMLLFFSTALGIVLFPIFSKYYSNGENNKIKTYINLFYKHIIFLTLPFFLIMIFFSDSIITILFGSSYISSSILLKVLSLGFFFYSIANINITIINSINKPTISTKLISLCAILNLILNIILVPIIGTLGAAISTIVSFFILFIVSTIVLWKITKFEFPIGKWILDLILGFVFIGLLYLLKEAIKTNIYLEIIITAGIGLLCYLGLGQMLKLIDIKELILLFKKSIKNK
jgi:O-antigen/teichoic acid export membrane protein